MHAGLMVDYGLRPLVFTGAASAPGADATIPVVDHGIVVHAQASAEVPLTATAPGASR